MTAPKEGIQRLLTSAGYYKGRIDGDWGDQTFEAASKIVARHKDRLVDYDQDWSQDRFIIAAAQLILYFTGNEPGAIDGMWGHNTQAAFDNWISISTSGKPIVIDRVPVANPPVVKTVFPKQSECASYYGNPGLPGTAADKAMQAKLVAVKIPFPFRIDYNLSQHVSAIRLHYKCAESAEQAYADVYKHYGKDLMIKLGLDRFAGSYNPRRMRGGTSWSMHAYGCAIDTYAGPNGLTTRSPQALFSRSEYDAWFSIWQSYGWTSLGKSIDRDYMHVQAARL